MKYNYARINQIYRDNEEANCCILGSSKFVVGSSKASIPQSLLNVSANAILTIKHART